MEKGKLSSTEWVQANVPFERFGPNGLIRTSTRAIRDSKSRELRFEITVPNAEKNVLPDDFGALLQCFGWTMAGLGWHLGDPPHETFHGCWKVMCELEAFLRLV